MTTAPPGDGLEWAEVRTVECLDDSQGIVDYTGEDYFGIILGAYLETKAPRRGLVGRAASELLDAGDLVDFAARWMTHHLSGPS